MLTFHLYAHIDRGWVRTHADAGPGALQHPQLTAAVVDRAQVAGPDAGAGPTLDAPPTSPDTDPNGLATRHLAPRAFQDLPASAAWERRGPLLLGDHAATLVSFARKTARWPRCGAPCPQRSSGSAATPWAAASTTAPSNHENGLPKGASMQSAPISRSSKVRVWARRAAQSASDSPPTPGPRRARRRWPAHTGPGPHPRRRPRRAPHPP